MTVRWVSWHLTVDKLIGSDNDRKQQVINWANVDSDLWRHLASLSHNESCWFLCALTNDDAQTMKPHIITFNIFSMQIQMFSFNKMVSSSSVCWSSPAGTRRNNNVFTTSTRRRVDVVKTLSLRNYCVMCPLGRLSQSGGMHDAWCNAFKLIVIL